MQPIYQLSRESIPEVTVEADFAVVMGGETLAQSWEQPGDEPEIIGRSLLKPFQFVAALNGVPLKDARWLIGLSSHSGEEVHEAALKFVRDSLDLPATLTLQCPAALPMNTRRSVLLAEQRVQPNAMFHPCAGKHLFAAYANRTSEAPVFDYTAVDSALQKRLEKIMQDYSGIPGRWTRDSCTMLTWIAPLSAHIRAWQAFMTDPQNKELIQVWTSSPVLSGGTGRLDTALMEQSKRTLVAKEGADGLLMVQTLDPEKPISILIKLKSGYNADHLGLALATLIQATNVSNETLQHFAARKIKGCPQDQEYASLIAAPNLP